MNNKNLNTVIKIQDITTQVNNIITTLEETTAVLRETTNQINNLGWYLLIFGLMIGATSFFVLSRFYEQLFYFS